MPGAAAPRPRAVVGEVRSSTTALASKHKLLLKASAAEAQVNRASGLATAISAARTLNDSEETDGQRNTKIMTAQVSS